MDLTWLDATRPDERDLAGALAVQEAARHVDHPLSAGTTMTPFRASLRHGHDGDPPETAVTHDGDGRVVGVLEVDFPTWDNTHLASVEATVDPRVRRQGLGRALFTHGAELARRRGRRVLLSFCLDGTPGPDFLKAMGLEQALEEIIRRLDVAALDREWLEREYRAALPHAAAYELVRLTAPAPDDLIPRLAEMTAAINDAPTGTLEIDDEKFPPERIRAYEEAQLARDRRFYRVVARHRDSGALAGHTVALVDRERPWLASQHDTSVVRAHRGHRLGLLLKAEMLRWLCEREPQVRTMDTGNAADNAHMIAVNEQLGYRMIARGLEWQRHL